MSYINPDTYTKMDQFVDEMNESINSVGDMSIFLFNRFRNFIGYMFIIITTVAIAFIVAEFVRGFAFSPIFGVDVYYIALGFTLFIGAYLAYYGEEAKIATIKGAIFSSGSNRIWQIVATFVVISILILVNAKGVQKIADFSLRYMDSELQDSYLLKLKETKMNNHAAVAKVDAGSGISDTAVKMLLLSRKSLTDAKQREIIAEEGSFKAKTAKYDKYTYRTFIAQKKKSMAVAISKIESKYAKRIANLDWKIAKAEEKVNDRIVAANKLRSIEMEKADEATAELETHYKTESGKNTDIIEKYKNIGLIVAIGGEIIDGVLAFVLFMIIKSNPNVNGTPTVQRNTRKMVRLEEHDTGTARIVRRNNKTKASPLTMNQKEYHRGESEEDLTQDLFEKIKEAAMMIAHNENKYRDGYLNHPTQRVLISYFRKKGVKVTERHIGQYFEAMGEDLIFINQKVGFVYAEKFAEVA